MSGSDRGSEALREVAPVSAPPFGVRLRAAIERRGPVCIGIDPSRSLLAEWGLTDDATGLQEFVDRCVEAFEGVVPVLKPQVAFFERHGAAGVCVLERLLAALRGSDLLVVADAKRGDVETTTEAYADAWLGAGSPLAADAVTAVPYLGVGALSPLVEAARANGRGVFVVARSSNPQGRPLQEATTAGGDTVEDMVLGDVAALNADDAAPLGSVGVVIGATLPPTRYRLGDLRGPILAPGLGAQGATARDVRDRFGDGPTGAVLPSVSRAVLAAGPDVPALRAAAVATREEIVAALV